MNGQNADTLAAEAVVRHDLFPDSRRTIIATAKRAVWRGFGWWVPIFCANCGKEGGLVPEENMDFVCWFCDNCEHVATAEKCDGFYTVPQRIFWAKVELEQRERYGRLLTEPELVTIVEADASPLATLLKQGR